VDDERKRKAGGIVLFVSRVNVFAMWLGSHTSKALSSIPETRGGLDEGREKITLKFFSAFSFYYLPLINGSLWQARAFLLFLLRLFSLSFFFRCLSSLPL